ncbi:MULTISPECIES: replication initiation protein [Campylobacter]|uniref:replication initiation protein n=1 Tax=Campylobacter TaxID=194 RepID=UPI0011174AAF|nr:MULTISPECIES: replication initiation protein [Campylobacter]MBF7068201.1 replication initiation protein [Campylobacter volucris]
MNDIVKYHNDFNKIKLPSFNEIEQDLLCGLMVRLKEEKNKVTFYPSDLRSILKSDYTNESLLEFSLSLREKFFKADFTIIEKAIIDKEEVTAYRTINLFTEFAIYVTNDKKELKSIEIQVNPRFEYILNQLTANFTSFELAEFIALSGKYTKTLYRLLKQYRTTGKAYFEWEEFCRIMDIPQDYEHRNINQRILNPAVKELSKERTLFDQVRTPFKNLAFEKKKISARGRGGKVVGIEFTFKPETMSIQKNENLNKLSDEEKQTRIIQNLIGHKIKYQDSILTINTIYENNKNFILSYYNEEKNTYGGFNFGTFKELKEKISKNLILVD